MLEACIVRFEGTNREGDLLSALHRFPNLRVEIIDSDSPRFSCRYDLVFLCGGFSWGDYVRAGAIAACSPVMRMVEKCASEGAMIVGLCNGFQILTEARLLPGALVRNASGKFICRWQSLSVPPSSSLGFSDEQQFWSLPIAHSEGRYVSDTDILDELHGEHRILMRYEDDNPNGSIDRIAGICDKTGRIIGLMPHPENAVSPLHASQDGAVFFQSVLRLAAREDTSVDDTC